MAMFKVCGVYFEWHGNIDKAKALEEENPYKNKHWNWKHVQTLCLGFYLCHH